jgi:hypothetical protein
MSAEKESQVSDSFFYLELGDKIHFSAIASNTNWIDCIVGGRTTLY